MTDSIWIQTDAISIGIVAISSASLTQSVMMAAAQDCRLCLALYQ